VAETRPSRDPVACSDNKHKKLQWNIENIFTLIVFKKPGWYFTTHILSGKTHTHILAGADPSFVGPEAYIILGVLWRKRIHNYEYKIRHESEHLFRMRKEITKYYTV
jgi:hypothetical protein